MDQQVFLLKQFVAACQGNPNILHDPKFEFYREYLTSLGATIPPKTEERTEAKPEENVKSETAPEPEIPQPAEIPYPEIDNSGVIEPEADEPLTMGDSTKEPSEEDLEKASEERDKANEAFSNGDFETSLKHYTSAIELNPGSALLHAKRANVLLKLKRPIAAIADCDKAISINPDSAQGYKFRGRANRLLGKWIEAKTDLATACKIDYDETANEWLKEVEPNANKLQEYNRAVERRKAEIELSERRERVRKAQEANQKAAEEEAKRRADDDIPFTDMPGMPGGGMPGGGMPGAGIFNDPDFLSSMNDPEVMSAMMDIMKNPASIGKYMGNPKLAKIINLIQQQGMGGAAPTGGCPSDCNDAGCGAPPPKAPEPDLD